MRTNLQYILTKIGELSQDDRTKVFLELSNDQTVDSIAEQIELVAIGELQDEIEEHYKNFGKFQGLSTGYKTLDNYTRGLVEGELTVIAGQTSHGKSSLALNIAYNLAVKGVTSLFVTLEMTHKEIGSRLRHIHGQPIIDLPILFQKNDQLDWRSVDPLIAKAKENGAKIVLLDHLHYFTRELDNVAEDLGRITKEIKKNAIRHEIPIILMSHVRKMMTSKQQAGIEDLRGSSYIAQDADIVLMVRRDIKDEGKLTIKIEKNRNRGYDYRNNENVLEFDGVRISEFVV